MPRGNSLKTTGIMSKKEERKDAAEFNKRPGEKAKLNAIRKKNKAQKYGEGVLTTGKNKGLVKGTGTQKSK